ncbi:MAG: MBL fold metallo-hydrolase [Magnetococcales bacterium]|nr:MBL fold metallo-hydrolase [Magnetococcales bacterium]
MGNLLTFHIAPGVIWLQVPEAGLNILCGCPAEVVKHLMRKGFISTVTKNGVTCETGPNVILLSDLMVQNGGLANLAEFPVLQMLYRQGMILPNHPNNTGVKPMLIGSSAQVRAQMAYIYRGNYGLTTKEEIMACGVDETMAEAMMRIKLKFAFGQIKPPSQFIDTLEIEGEEVEIRHGVRVRRIGINQFRFSYRGRHANVDLNLAPDHGYETPYPLGHHRVQPHYFAVLHTGEGDGWDINRPCMSSVIMFQGRIYLIDAGPGIVHSLTALGIDVSEVAGIFHTHAHDDHFAGLPELIHTDRRLKYFATPLVRSSVAKKFSALLAIKEEKFGQFFDIHDLTFDTWNDCDGLKVMPFFSPHPLETNIFYFQALDVTGNRTYAHWADISSWRVLDGMVGSGEKDVPAEVIDKVKADYLRPADLKKIDAGGGMIHGVAEDFQNDSSSRLVLAHIARPLTSQEKQIGSETFFGALNVLIPGQQDYLKQRAYRLLSTYFPELNKDHLLMLLNCPIVEYNAGTIIRRPGATLPNVEMVLSGVVSYLEDTHGAHKRLSYGSLLGIGGVFGDDAGTEGTYRAISNCSMIGFPLVQFKSFLDEKGLLSPMKRLIDKIWFLRKTRLFGEQTTFFRLIPLAQSLETVVVASGQAIDMTNTGPLLSLVKEGRVVLLTGDDQVLEEVEAGGALGEESYFDDGTAWRWRTETEVTLYRLRGGNLLDIPIIHWKMLEAFERRRNLFITD